MYIYIYLFIIKEFSKYNNKIMSQSNIMKCDVS